MKKLTLLIISILFLVGCSCSMKTTPKMKVENFLNSYRKLDADVLTEIDTQVKKENYTEEQQEIYKDVLKRQYSDLEYNILEEIIDGDNATVTAEIIVYDLYKAQTSSATYLAQHKEEFYKDNKYDESLYLTYKLKEMKSITDKVTYTISFNLTLADNKWVIDEVSNDMLEKIHGIYNYQNK